MPAITTNDLKNGMTLQLDNGLFTVVEFQHVKPGKGVAGYLVEQAILEKKDMQYVYADGDDYVFMDTVTYDQLNVPPSALGDAAQYLVPQANANLAMYQGEIVSVDIPASVELMVAETEPGIQGDRVSGARKPATLETGKVIQVPLFVNTGDRVRVDTRTGDYITRV